MLGTGPADGLLRPVGQPVAGLGCGAAVASRAATRNGWRGTRGLIAVAQPPGVRGRPGLGTAAPDPGEGDTERWGRAQSGCVARLSLLCVKN